MNSFIVENSPSTVTRCLTCSVKIEKRELRFVIAKTTTKSEYYHLKCFTPKLPQYIREKDISLRNIGDENKKLFKEWLYDWNSKYFPLDSMPSSNIAMKSIMHDKSLQTNPTKNRRILIEVFKFLDVYDLIKSLAYVNKEYYQTTWEPELWRFLLMRDFNEIASEEIIIRHKYLELLMVRCIECNKINYEYRDPLLKRVLCITCRSLIKYHVIGKTEIKNLFRICPDQLNLKFGFTPGFANGYGLITYIDLLFKSLRNFREKNKRFVLDKLYEELDDNCKLVRDINEINPGNMDKVHEQYGRIEKVEVNWDCNNHDKDYRNIYKFIRNGAAKINFQKIFKKLKGKHN